MGKIGQYARPSVYLGGLDFYKEVAGNFMVLSILLWFIARLSLAFLPSLRVTVLF